MKRMPKEKKEKKKVQAEETTQMWLEPEVSATLFLTLLGWYLSAVGVLQSAAVFTYTTRT